MNYYFSCFPPKLLFILSLIMVIYFLFFLLGQQTCRARLEPAVRCRYSRHIYCQIVLILPATFVEIVSKPNIATRVQRRPSR